MICASIVIGTCLYGSVLWYYVYKTNTNWYNEIQNHR